MWRQTYYVAAFILLASSLILIVGMVTLWRQADAGQDGSEQKVTIVANRIQLPRGSQTVTPAIVAESVIDSTPTLEPRVVASNTSTFTPVPSATSTDTFTPLPTDTPSITPTNTQFPTSTITPTSDESIPSTVTSTPIIGGPGQAPLLSSGDYDIFNVLLLGNDSRPDGRVSYRTDVVTVVSVNKTTATVNMLSIPRDLYVYIPTIGFSRINAVVALGEVEGWPKGGIDLLKATIQYNFGIPIHGYAQVDFTGFERIIDAVGGVDLVVDCPLTDYRLKSSELNPLLFENWHEVTLDVGVHRMDGPTALWFARSRVTTSDFDRNRRHQVLLRAIWHRFQLRDMWDDIPELWDAFSDIVDTDLSIEEIISLAPIGIQLSPELIESHFIGLGEVEPFQTAQGGSVLRLRPVEVQTVVQKFYSPPTQNHLFQQQPRVEILNQSGIPNLGFVAQERLAWDGFPTFVNSQANDELASQTLIYDYTGDLRGGSVDILQRVLGGQAVNIISEPDPNRTVDYRIVLGQSYDSCTYNPWQSWPQVN